MNKSELVDRVAVAVNVSKAAATRALEAVLDGITDALRQGEIVTLLGFGTFSVRDRAARKGHNPKTGEALAIKATRVPGFKAGKALKDAVQSEKDKK